jgi:hypothetical protein
MMIEMILRCVSSFWELWGWFLVKFSNFGGCRDERNFVNINGHHCK